MGFFCLCALMSIWTMLVPTQAQTNCPNNWPQPDWQFGPLSYHCDASCCQSLTQFPNFVANTGGVIIYNSQISSIPDGTFNGGGLNQLKYIRIDRNKITQILANTFDNLPALVQIYLGANDLHFISKLGFGDIAPTVSLQLTNNNPLSCSNGNVAGFKGNGLCTACLSDIFEDTNDFVRCKNAPPISPPTNSPTTSPTTPYPTPYPTVSPTTSPTTSPTISPTTSPTIAPTISPTVNPTTSPTTPYPTVSPTVSPTISPTTSPTESPTVSPTPCEPELWTMKRRFTKGQEICPGYTPKLFSRGPRFGFTARVCGFRNGKFRNRLIRSMFYSLFGETYAGKTCTERCVHDIENENFHYTWNSNKRCWRLLKNKECSSTTNAEREYIAQRMALRCS